MRALQVRSNGLFTNRAFGLQTRQDRLDEGRRHAATRRATRDRTLDGFLVRERGKHSTELVQMPPTAPSAAWNAAAKRWAPVASEATADQAWPVAPVSA